MVVAAAVAAGARGGQLLYAAAAGGQEWRHVSETGREQVERLCCGASYRDMGCAGPGVAALDRAQVIGPGVGAAAITLT